MSKDKLKVIPLRAVMFKVGEGDDALHFLRLQSGPNVSWTQSLGNGWQDLAGGIDEVKQVEADFQQYLKELNLRSSDDAQDNNGDNE